MSNAIKNRYDFIIYFDVENGNPNGDPDAGNMPRIDPETGLGLVTDVCLKRKIRNYVEAVKEGEPGYRKKIKKGVPLNRSDNEAFEKVGISDAASIKKGEDLQKKLKEAKKNKEGEDADIIIRDYMCGEFFDIRTFGAVMTTMVKGALNCGQMRRMPRERATRWAINSLSRTGSIAVRVIFPLILPENPPASVKKISSFCGMQSLICLILIVRQQEVRWL